jgi:hypothetical protein
MARPEREFVCLFRGEELGEKKKTFERHHLLAVKDVGELVIT